MLVKTACGVVGFSVLRCSHTIMYAPRLDASPPSHRRFFLRISMQWTKNPAFLCSRMIKTLERLVRAAFLRAVLAGNIGLERLPKNFRNDIVNTCNLSCRNGAYQGEGLQYKMRGDDSPWTTAELLTYFYCGTKRQ